MKITFTFFLLCLIKASVGYASSNIEKNSVDCVISNETPPLEGYVVRLATIAQMQAYTDTAKAIFVTDSLRGGLFRRNLTPATYTVDNGTIFAATGQGAGYYWVRSYTQSDGLNVRWFGAKGDGVTDDGNSINQGIQTARALGQALYFIKTPTSYKAARSFILGGDITIKGNGAKLNDVPTNSSVKSVFIIDSLSTTANIVIDGLNLTGIAEEVKFITSKSGTAITPPVRFKINSIKITNCTGQNNPIIINFNPIYIEISNVTLGLGITGTENVNPGISITQDSLFVTGRSLIIDKCVIYRGTRDGDMFVVKGGSYNDVRVTNCLANTLGTIVEGTGDGFDMDNLGKNVILSNLKVINCDMDIKSGHSVFGTYNLVATNLVAVNSPVNGISIRASGSYSNISSYNCFGTGIVIAGYSAEDGSTQNNVYINANNLQVINGGNKGTAAAITVGLDNINLNNIQISNDYRKIDSPQIAKIASGIRFSSAKNVTISNLNIKDARSAIITTDSARLNDVTFNNVHLTNISSRVLNFSSISVNNFFINKLDITNFTGSMMVGLSGTFVNNVYTNVPASLITDLAGGSSFFNSISPNFLLNNTVYDKSSAAGVIPAINPLFPVGHFITNVADGSLWYRKTATAIMPVLSASAAITTSASTLTLSFGRDYVFTGSGATYTLPSLTSSFTGRGYMITIKNRGSGAITVNTAGGAVLYTTSAVSTVTLNPGDTIRLLPDTSFFNVE